MHWYIARFLLRAIKLIQRREVIDQVIPVYRYGSSLSPRRNGGYMIDENAKAMNNHGFSLWCWWRMWELNQDPSYVSSPASPRNAVEA